jgi:hypothetical protein
MPKGKSEIPDLRLQRLQGLIESFKTPPNLVLTGLFGSFNAESDTIKWESQQGTRGLTPFVAPGAPAPMTAPIGLTKHQAVAAYWKEKMYFDEVFLNNLRQEGTLEQYKTAQRTLADNMQMLRNRCDRRKEWMFAKMLNAGSFSYTGIGGIKLSVDYDIPSTSLVTLAADRYWDDGANRNVLEDIMDAKLTLKNAMGAEIDYALFTSEILKVLVLDTGIQTLLQKSAYGNGDLFARPSQVLGTLLDIKNFVIYDEQFQLKARLTANLSAAGTTIYIEDTTDWEVGQYFKIHDASEHTYEELGPVTAVSMANGTITVATGPTNAYKVGEDYVTMTTKFLDTKKFTMFSSTVEGRKIAEFLGAPFGLGRHWGMYVDSEDVWDPEGTYIRVQNKGLPVLYNRDAFYVLTVMD